MVQPGSRTGRRAPDPARRRLVASQSRDSAGCPLPWCAHMRFALLALLLAGAVAFAPAALADGWLPHPSDATWTYEWSDSAYNPTPTKEKVTVDKKSNDTTFVLDWTTDGLDNPAAAPSSAGNVSFQETNSGLQPTDWQS